MVVFFIYFLLCFTSDDDWSAYENENVPGLTTYVLDLQSVKLMM